MKRGKCVKRMRWMAIAIASMVVAAAAPVAAHGPTVEISAAGFKPQLLNLFEGTTVHFTNAIAAAGNAAQGVVVTDVAGSFESPLITADGDGWHYTFEKSGAYEIRVQQRPEAKMRIVVVKKPAP